MYAVLRQCCFFIIISASNADFDKAVLPYSCTFAAVFGGTVLFGTLAIKYGPLSLSALFTAYAQLIPTAAGVILWKEKMSVQLILGVICLVVSLFLDIL